jgi:4-amino-4-deoxy-L-arabinose transferase-like glycosyltransferase
MTVGLTSKLLWKIFFAALAIRWVYALGIFASMGEAGLTGTEYSDSHRYLGEAHSFAAAILANAVHGWDWLGPSLVTMPLFTWLMTLHVLLFGASGPLAYVLTQGVLDAGTCLLVYGLARELNARYTFRAAIAAVINPPQIILSGLVYTDTPFAFCVALFLFAAVRWLRAPTARWAILLGLGLGAAALIRILVAPWAAILLLFLLFAAAFGHRLSSRAIPQLAGAAAIVGLCLAPVLGRNVAQYDSWALTPQAGVHLARWVVPLVQEARNGTPWARGQAEMEERVRERFGPPAANPFEESRRYNEIGREELGKLGTAAMAKAWIFGAAINLGAPAIILSPPIAQLPRTGFYDTVGSTLLAKVGNFLFRSDNAFYAWALLLGIAGVAIVRAIQLCGFIGILRGGGQWPSMLLLAGWFVYVLAINGPIASPKYRLPLEPLLCVLTGAGFCLLRTWRKKSA